MCQAPIYTPGSPNQPCAGDSIIMDILLKGEIESNSKVGIWTPLDSGASGKEYFCQWSRCKRHLGQSLGQEDPLEEGIAIQSSILAWSIPWTEEPGGLQSTGLQRVGQDLETEQQ